LFVYLIFLEGSVYSDAARAVVPADVHQVRLVGREGYVSLGAEFDVLKFPVLDPFYLRGISLYLFSNIIL